MTTSAANPSITLPAGLALVDGFAATGNLYYDEAQDISLFEDTQEYPDPPLYYAWSGDGDAHDTAEHTDVYDNPFNAYAVITARRTMIRGREIIAPTAVYIGLYETAHGTRYYRTSHDAATLRGTGILARFRVLGPYELGPYELGPYELGPNGAADIETAIDVDGAICDCCVEAVPGFELNDPSTWFTETSYESTLHAEGEQND